MQMYDGCGILIWQSTALPVESGGPFNHSIRTRHCFSTLLGTQDLTRHTH